jgi:hypothetical protein
MKAKSFSRKAVCGMAAIGVAVGLIAGGAVGLALQPEPVVVTKIVTEQIEVEVPFEVVVEKNVTVTVEVPVENKTFLGLACDRVFYDDLSECKEEVEAENAALVLAWEEVERKGFDMLEDEELFEDEDDIEFVRLYKDFEDIVVEKSKFDREEYEFVLRAKAKDDDVKKYVLFSVEVDNGEAKLLSVVEEE